MDIATIKPLQTLELLQSISEQGIKDTVRRLRMYMSQIFQYAIVAEYCEADPAAPIKNALPKTVSKRMPARTDPAAVRELFRACYHYRASQTVRNALLFQALTAIRPGNAQKAEWAEIDFEKAVWTIRDGKMKMRREFKIPLSTAVWG